MVCLFSFFFCILNNGIGFFLLLSEGGGGKGRKKGGEFTSFNLYLLNILGVIMVLVFFFYIKRGGVEKGRKKGREYFMVGEIFQLLTCTRNLRFVLYIF